MTHFPASPFWSVMFFLMLVNLGLGSMFGTIEGIITPIVDTFKVRKEILTGELYELSFLHRAVSYIFWHLNSFFFFYMKVYRAFYRALNHYISDSTSMHRHINIRQ